MLYKTLLDETREKFDINKIGSTVTPKPFCRVDLDNFKNVNTINLMVKTNVSRDVIFSSHMEKTHPDMCNSLRRIILDAGAIIHDFDERFVYVSLHTSTVIEDTTHRAKGWHIDGLQIDTDYAPCIHLIAHSSCPTLFNLNANAPTVNPLTHDIFANISKNICPSQMFSTSNDILHLVNAYHVHRCIKAIETHERTFMRVSFSHVAITSNTMDINDNIDYPYDIHTTTGEIPSHLIK